MLLKTEFKTENKDSIVKERPHCHCCTSSYPSQSADGKYCTYIYVYL